MKCPSFSSAEITVFGLLGTCVWEIVTHCPVQPTAHPYVLAGFHCSLEHGPGAADAAIISEAPVKGSQWKEKGRFILI